MAAQGSLIIRGDRPRRSSTEIVCRSRSGTEEAGGKTARIGTLAGRAAMCNRATYGRPRFTERPQRSSAEIVRRDCPQRSIRQNRGSRQQESSDRHACGTHGHEQSSDLWLTKVHGSSAEIVRGDRPQGSSAEIVRRDRTRGSSAEIVCRDHPRRSSAEIVLATPSPWATDAPAV